MTAEAGEQRLEVLVGVLSDEVPFGAPRAGGPIDETDLAELYDAMRDREETTAGPDRETGASTGGLSIPDFTILRKLGAGGMGAVYLARQESLGRTVAVKVMTGLHFDSEHALRRFEREARAAARISHPDVCTIHDFGQHEGSPYIVMEYVEGEPLTSFIHSRDGGGDEDFHLSISTSLSHDEGPADPSMPEPETGSDDGWSGSTSASTSVSSRHVRAALALMARSARAVGAVHDVGIIHRDLKPANIMVRPDGSPMILDFGLASELSDGASATVEGSAVGTPAWMAPEQVRGEIGELDHSTDVYALGVILYELLTGVRPFVAANVDALYRLILRGDAVSPRTLNPKVPVDVAAVCLKAMDLDQSRRYTTATELADDLERALEGRPTVARPVGRVTRLWLRARRNPWQSVAAAAVILLAVAVPIIFDLSAERSRAVDETVNAQLAVLRCVDRWQAGDEADPADEAVVRNYFPTEEAFASFQAAHDLARIESFLESVRARTRALGEIELRSPRASVEGDRPTFVFTPDLFASDVGATFVIEVFANDGDPVRRFIIEDATFDDGGNVSFDTPADQALTTAPDGAALSWRVHASESGETPPRVRDTEAEFRLFPVGTVAGLRDEFALDEQPADDILLRSAALLSRGFAVAALRELDGLPAVQGEPLATRRRLLRAQAHALRDDVEAMESALLGP